MKLRVYLQFIKHGNQFLNEYCLNRFLKNNFTTSRSMLCLNRHHFERLNYVGKFISLMRIVDA